MQVSEWLIKSGISPSDTVMVHGNAAVSTLYTECAPEQRLTTLIRELIDYFSGGGTLVVPTFTYSFTKNQDFDVERSPSDVGQFSEAFRQTPGVHRTSHPLFSVGVIGSESDRYLSARLDDCFGLNTIFHNLYESNAVLICLGCAFNLTFIHHIEQLYGVPYRFTKKFKGIITRNGYSKMQTTEYFVRDLSIRSESDLVLLRDRALQRREMVSGEIGRFTAQAIRATKLAAIAREMLNQDIYSLVAEYYNR